MTIQPKAVRKVSNKLRSQGRVPCFVATRALNYLEARSAYGVAKNDFLQIDGMLVLPVYSPTELDMMEDFLVVSVDSEKTLGGIS